jgi:prepilin-type processing-associated H-X9-DG protein
VREQVFDMVRGAVDEPSRVILSGEHTWTEHWSSSTSMRGDFPFWHRRPGRHNLSFVDGHAQSERIAKGLHVTGGYSILPFRRLWALASGCQVETPLN